MLKFFVGMAAVLVIFFILVGVVAPATPDGSFLHEFGDDVRGALDSWFGNPVSL